ncbi:MAG TPA: ABC transporter ATP-binding protein [Firmicutes bacterium]|nr:ABC transporter ATP-binding protein [Bacillota bacterium]
MIELRDIKKIYALGENQVMALRGVSLQIERGEMISIMGPSGSGKSTLLHILGCLDMPDSGEYLLENTDITTLSDKEISRIRNEHFGFVFQAYNLLPELNAIENVCLPMIIGKIPKKEQKEKAAFLLKKVGLDHRLNHFPNQLSGGEQQRVAVARALANDPTLILADEPTGNLATKQSNDILDMFCQLNDEGVTIVLVTHDAEVGARSKRIIKLQDGLIDLDTAIKERHSAEYLATLLHASA